MVQYWLIVRFNLVQFNVDLRLPNFLFVIGYCYWNNQKFSPFFKKKKKSRLLSSKKIILCCITKPGVVRLQLVPC